MTKRQLHIILCVLAGFAGFIAGGAVTSTRPMDPATMKEKINECESLGLEVDIIYRSRPDEDVISDIQCFPPGEPRG